MMTFIESMFKSLVKKVTGKSSVQYGEEKISFTGKFKRVTFADVLKRYALINDLESATTEDLRLKAQQFGIEFSKSDSKAKIADMIYAKICRPKMIQPTFLVEHPMDISPLAKKKKDKEHVADRFQLVAGGLELVNGFSELNDPLEQRERFERQQELRESGDSEASELDEAFLEAMEYGMPPAVGVGIGIDRLVMFLTDAHNIREVVLFPTLKKKE